MSDQSSVYTAFQGNSYLFGGNAPYVEEMYENYLANPGSVPDHWRDYFDALQHVPAVDGSNAKDVPHLPVVNAFAERAKQGGTRVVGARGADSEMARKRTAVQQLIAAYRNVGARWADLDPLKRTERENIPELEPSFYGFSDADQEAVFNTSNTFFGKDSMSLRELINALRETYCGTLGAEYMYISGWVSEGVSCSLWPSLRKQTMSTTTSLANSMRYSSASCVASTTASGSSPFTCSTGASIIFTTSVQYSVERLSRGSEVVKPIWLLITMCTVPPVK